MKIEVKRKRDPNKIFPTELKELVDYLIKNPSLLDAPIWGSTRAAKTYFAKHIGETIPKEAYEEKLRYIYKVLKDPEKKGLLLQCLYYQILKKKYPKSYIECVIVIIREDKEPFYSEEVDNFALSNSNGVVAECKFFISFYPRKRLKKLNSQLDNLRTIYTRSLNSISPKIVTMSPEAQLEAIAEREEISFKDCEILSRRGIVKAPKT